MVSVYLYIPNLLGYARLALVGLAWLAWEWPVLFIVLYSSGAILDAFDGWAARRFNQTSAFGAWLDVVIDNIGRTMLWTGIVQWGWIVASLEWSVFACTHCSGANWKVDFENAPGFVKMVMAKGFKQPMGTLAIAGLHALPIVHYGMQRHLLHQIDLVLQIARTVLAAGRVLCGAVECWCVYNHTRRLVAEDMKK